MKKADAMYAYARNHKLGQNITPFVGGWLQRKHFSLIEAALGKDEEVVASFIGRHHPEDNENFTPFEDESRADFEKRVHVTQTGKVRYFDCKGFHAYAVTDAGRLIFARWVPFNHDYKSIPLNNINTINPNTRIFWGSLRIESFREVFSIFWTKRTVFAIANLLEDSKSDMQDGVMDGITSANRAQQAKQEATSSKPQLTTETNFEKLRERKKALDAGLITQEEYEEYKQRFLQ
ncbi:hypothetical protein EsVE80_19350 [Enterococcus saigonensis]|uniref:SHOCT domain-containing protein n=1 Tax=Enterococcus saigonensis TaxID=1805431 RepID=A0A679IJT5_9ENTE|nr:SHOCT domain-containing protein [Enterococcus saigonensis]BCA86412.1 hypothetical protein EsVE80_19350 [Enterococcus saigonensis]